MSAVYPASCGLCGRLLYSDHDVWMHVGSCYYASQPGEKQ